MSIQEMREGLAYVSAELLAIHERAEGTPLDEDTQARFDDGLAYVDETRAAVEAIEAREARSEELRGLVESGRAKIEAPNVNLSGTRDVFDLGTVDRSSPERTESQLRDRALEVIERHAPAWVSDSAKEAATATAEKRTSKKYDSAVVREHMVRTSSPAYIEAFEAWAHNPSLPMNRELAEYHGTRAAMSLTAANGGVLVPQWLDPTIILTNSGAFDEVYANARVEQVTVDQADFVTSAGVTAEWLSEGTEAADATPTFVGPTITNHKRAAWLYGSYEMLADSGFDGVAGLIADAFDRQNETFIATGTGSSQPYGLVTRLSGTGPTVAGSSGAAGAADLVVVDVYALDNALGSRWRRNAKFVACKKTYNSVRQLNSNSAGSTFWVDLGGGLPAELIGYQALRNEGFDSTIVSGSNDDVLLLGDLTQYIITPRVGTTIMFEPMVKGASGGRPTGQAGWFAFSRIGADVATSNAFKLLRL